MLIHLKKSWKNTAVHCVRAAFIYIDDNNEAPNYLGAARCVGPQSTVYTLNDEDRETIRNPKLGSQTR